MRSLPALLLAALGLAGCQAMPGGSTTRAVAADARFPQILGSGLLRVAVSPDRPPLNLKRQGGEIAGFEVDIVQALATAMGLELKLVEVPFADLLPSSRRGRADLAISGLTMTPERNARVAFAGPYFVSGMSVLRARARSPMSGDPRRSMSPIAVMPRWPGRPARSSSRDVLPRAKLITSAITTPGSRW